MAMTRRVRADEERIRAAILRAGDRGVEAVVVAAAVAVLLPWLLPWLLPLPLLVGL